MVFSSKGYVWLKLWFRLQAATKSMTNKGSEKPWQAKNKGTTGRWCWRAHGGSCAFYSCPFLMRYDYGFILKMQCLIEALIQTTGSNQIHDQQEFREALTGQMRATTARWSWRAHGGSCASYSCPFLMRYDYGFLLKRQCLIEALIQTTGSNQIHDQQGLREALTAQVRGLQAVGVEEFMEKVVPHIHIHF